ncbi:MAG: SDR family oxidoreductase [Proteobacteria bacterium]|nr:SDR family oxidoreductase [Pseudomonadota bacterium]MBU1712507.1 SDR family oxidoreductase [Pseudomonadota bacterium]
MQKAQTFRGKVVVITGAASGIGAAICRKFADEGAKIGLMDADEKGAKDMESSLTGSGTEAFAVKCDVSSEKECDFAIKAFITRYGGIDVLVNNAGITQRGAFMETRASVFRKVMDINFFGSLYCTKAAIESIVERKGMIIVIESVAGVTPLLGRSGYCASKHALHGLFTTIRTEIRNAGAHVMIACPGFVKTNLQTRALGADGSVTKHPQSKVGKETTPEAVANEIFMAALKRKNMVVLTFIGKLVYWISRIAPIFYEKMMARKLRSELEK